MDKKTKNATFFTFIQSSFFISLTLNSPYGESQIICLFATVFSKNIFYYNKCFWFVPQEVKCPLFRKDQKFLVNMENPMRTDFKSRF